jgi:F0F1-type ATP synthase membrane subunit b/b'
MARERPSWQFRLRTLILLVIIAGLALALVTERFNRAVEAQRREARVQQALAEAQALAAQARLAEAEAAAGDAALREPQDQSQDPW